MANLSKDKLLLIFFALFVFNAKFFLITQYGNATPYWDQWNAEAELLYKPYLEGNLSWSSLLAPHNEHRIFTTRILALGLLELNGSWNPLLQMVVNAVIHVVALGLIIILLLRVIGRQHLPLLLAFAALLFSVPYAWENTLAGFQSQFYFVLIFGVLCLWLLITAAPLSLKWWAGMLAGLLAFLSLASGLFAVVAALCVMLFQYALGVRRNYFQLLGVLLLSIFVYFAFPLTPVIEHHAALKAHSLDQFIQALEQVLTWPVESSRLLGGLLYLPALIFGIMMMVQRPPVTDKRWFLLAVVVWCVGQCVSLAYGRAIVPTSSRYLDLVAIGLLINFAIVLLFVGMIEGKGRYLAHLLGLGWVVIVVTGLAGMHSAIEAQLVNKQALSRIQESHVRAYLCDGGAQHLQNKPFLHIPYWDPKGLQQLLDDEAIRKILPGNIYIGNSDTPIALDGAPFCPPGKLVNSYSIQSWSGETSAITVDSADVRADSWRGSDYLMSQLNGLRIIGSLVASENDTGYVVVRVRRGDRLLYRTGPRVNKQAILVGVGGVGEFYADAPFSSEWSLIIFDSPRLPAEFDVVFIDAGTGWGEWSAIGLKQVKSE